MAAYVADGRVRLAFWHVLDHGNPSVIAHQAAECAGAQNSLAFWQLHDLLFERQAELWQATSATLTQFAVELGLNEATFGACLADPAIAEKVARMDQTRRDQGLRTRPSFDVNGKVIQGAIPFTTFATVLDEALAGQ